MSSNNGNNDWDVSYSVISFFERALDGHSKVQSFNRINDIVFEISTWDGLTLKIVLVNEYSLGLAAVLKAKSDFPEIEYVVTCANWNGYTKEAKQHGISNNIGIFNLGEFLGALNWDKPKKYCKKDSKGNPIYAYKSA